MFRKSVGSGVGGSRGTPLERRRLSAAPSGSRIPQSQSLRRVPPSSSARRVSTTSDRSSAYGLARGGKDERQLSDKAFQARAVRAILERLGADGRVTERQLRSPTRKDFIHIFTALIQMLHPDFQLELSTRLEHEVPQLLKDIGYPYQIPASTFQTIGATHSWPKLLGALYWLHQLIQFGQNFQPQSQFLQEDFFDQPDAQSDVHSYAAVKLNYHLMCASSTPRVAMDVGGGQLQLVEVENQEAWLREQLLGNGAAVEAAATEVDAQITRDGNRIDQLHLEKETDRRVETDLETLQDELARFDNFFLQSKDYLARINSDIRSLESDLGERRSKVAELEGEVAKKEKVIAGQKLSSTEVDALVHEQEQLWRELEEKRGALALDQERVFALEKELASENAGVRSTAESVVTGVQELLARVPREIAPSGWSERLPLHLSPFDPSFAEEWRSRLCPGLVQLVKALRGRREGMKTALVDEEKSERDLGDEVAGLELELSRVMAEVGASEREVERKAEVRKEEERRLTREVGRREQRLGSLKQSGSLSVAELREELAGAQEESERTEKSEAAIVNAAADQLRNKTEKLLSLHQKYRLQNQHLTTTFQDIVKEMQNN